MNRLLAGLGIAVLVFGIVAVHLWREAGIERGRNQVLEARIVALESARDGQATLTGGPQSTSVPQVVAQGEAAAVAPAAGPSAAGTANPIAAGIRQTMDTPEGREFTRSMMRMNLERQYPDLAQELNVTPEQADQLLDLLVRRTTDVGTDRATLRSAGMGDRSAREEAARQLAGKEQAYEAQMAEMLGSSYPRWKEYQRTSAQRQQESYVRQGQEQLRNAVSTRSNPLSEARFADFSAALDAEQKRIDQEAGRLSAQQQLQRLPESNRRLVEVAAAHLDAEQLERYRQQLVGQKEMMRAVMGAMGAATGAQDAAAAEGQY